MRTAEEVRHYLEGVGYPARPEDLIAAAQERTAELLRNPGPAADRRRVS
jgi:hypothetical protein